MLRPVTAGLNGSPESTAAAGWGAREAVRRERPLRLVYAWDWLPHTPAAAGRHRAGKMLDEMVTALRARHPGLDVTTDQIEAPPSKALVAVADEAELLVLGSRGLGGITGFLVGSVALSTVAHATRPVVLVRAGAAEGDGPPRDVVLGLDVEDPSDTVIAFAFDAAARRGAPLRVVHAWNLPPIYGRDDGTEGPDLAADAELEVRESREFTDALLPWRGKFPGIEVVQQVVTGRAGHQLVDAALDADLLVVGRRTRHHVLGTHIGSVTHAVLHHAVCPVAVVPYD